jgi:hypothetical protein
MLADDTERSRYSRCTAQTCCVKPIVSSNVDSLAARRMRVHPWGVTAPGSISARSSCPTTAYTSAKARATATADNFIGPDALPVYGRLLAVLVYVPV